MMFVNAPMQMFPFLALGAVGIATLVVAVGALRSSRRSEELGENRLELLREQHERLELMREERRMLVEELERERRERLEAQGRVKQLMREHPHLELEREIQRLTEELELEREGRLHNHRERQRLAEELEHERLTRLEDQREAKRDVGRLEQEIERLVQELGGQWKGQRKASRAKKSLWGNLFGGKNEDR
jgi:superfamily II DNA helicase RecQ